MDKSTDTGRSGKRSLIRRHTTSWESKTPKALVYDPSRPDVVTEEDVNERNKETNLFEVQLPRWRNRVYICQEPDNKGYIFTMRIDRMGFVKNCKRRLGIDYKVLHVKGDKSCEI